MSWRAIRPLVIGLVYRDDELLVGEGFDPAENEQFYRPIGGAIEFGERSDAALLREFREELDAPITDVRYVDLLENRFTFDGESEHELVLVYEAAFADERYYERDAFTAYEAEIDEEFRVVWVPLDRFESGEAIVYPDGILDLVRR